ncbi:hypothetical protein IMZ48_13160, partial [Candidatus Bathyarchaeota archaeon]|nr:hypothetical protein [Candidatus Bathyarchaeota archaeon]
MAEQQKTVEVPQVEVPVAETAAETKPVEAPAAEEKPAEDKVVDAPAAEDKPAEEKAAETDAPAAEEKKEDATPVEEGTLEHKGAGANFPKNLYYSKQPFWFGTDVVEKKNLAAYLKHEKSSDVAFHTASWAQS